MKRLRVVFVSIAAAATVAQAAVAADLSGPSRRSIKDGPITHAAAPFSWTGLYVGAHVGYGWSDIDSQATRPLSPAATMATVGWPAVRSATIGNRAVSVYGVEADIASSWIDGGNGCCGHSVNWLASVRGARRPDEHRQSLAVLRDSRRCVGRCGIQRRGFRHVLGHAFRLGRRRRHRARAHAQPDRESRVSVLRLRQRVGSGRCRRRGCGRSRPDGADGAVRAEFQVLSRAELASQRGPPRGSRAEIRCDRQGGVGPFCTICGQAFAILVHICCLGATCACSVGPAFGVVSALISVVISTGTAT